VKTSLEMIGSAIMLFILILEPSTALTGGIKGIEVCLNSLLPVLFPFCVLTTYLSCRINAISRFLTPLGRLCKIPSGLEALFPISFIAGYPIGISIISAEYKAGLLSRQEAQRLTGFCSNAGISFVFGILGCLFDSYWIPFWTMLVLILSGLMVGIILPGTRIQSKHRLSAVPIKFVDAVHAATGSMMNICSWVMLFSIVNQYLQKWLTSMTPHFRCIIIGVLEVSNGVLCLNTIDSPALRWIIGCTLLSFGGICVTMQSLSISQDLELRWYICGKILQSSISCVLAGFLQSVFPLFPEKEPIVRCVPAVIPGILSLIFLYLLMKSKKRVENLCAI
jgi:hypothetical protein